MADNVAPTTSAPATPAAAPTKPSAAPAVAKPPAAKPPVTADNFRSRLMSGDFDYEDAPQAAETEPTHNVPSEVPDAPEEPEAVETAPEELEASPDEQEQEPEQEDLAWLQELKEFKELHGLPIKDILTALAQGQLPDALMDKIKVRLKDGDDEWEDTLQGARQAAMLRSNYTKKRMQEAAERDAFNAEKEQFVGIVREWTTGAGMHKGIQEVFGREVFLEAAKLLALEEQQLDEMEEKMPGARKFFEDKHKAEMEAAKLQRELKRLQEGQTQTQQQNSEKQVVDFVRSTAPSMFEQVGVRLNDASWDMFKQHMKILVAEHGTPNEAMIKFAVEATKEEIDKWVAKYHGTPAAAPAPAAKPAPAKKPTLTLGGKAFDAPPPKQSAKLVQGGRETPAQFKQRVLDGRI